jgi:DHA2 family multidrug resistance protein
MQGLGMALFFMPLTAISLSNMPAHQIANASSLSNFCRLLAGSIGASITTTIWDNRQALHHSRLTEEVTAYNSISDQFLSGLKGLGMSAEQAYAYVNALITKEGAVIGANEIFWGMGIIYLSLIALVWFARPPFTGAVKGAGSSGAH